jgi:hypothetical protein
MAAVRSGAIGRACLAIAIVVAALGTVDGASAVAGKKRPASKRVRAGSTHEASGSGEGHPSGPPSPNLGRQSGAASARAESSLLTAAHAGGGESAAPKPATSDDTAGKKTPDEIKQAVSKAYHESGYYHATASENLKGPSGIEAKGLDPNRGGNGGASEAANVKQFRQNSSGAVHITKSRGTANFYSRFIEKPQQMGKEPPGPGKPSSQLQVFLSGEQRVDVDSDDPRQAYKTSEPIPADHLRVRGQNGSAAFRTQKAAAIRERLPAELRSLSDEQILNALQEGHEDGHNSDSDGEN